MKAAGFGPKEEEEEVVGAIARWGNTKDLCATVSDHGEAPKAKGEPKVL